MNQTQISATVASIITSIGGFAIGKGWLTSDQLTQIALGIGALIAAGVSIYATRNHALVTTVAALPKVQQVVMTDQATADSHPSEKVVGPSS